MGPGVSAKQIAQRIGDRLGERGRDPDRHRDAEPVSQAAHVFHADPSCLPCDPDADRTPSSLQFCKCSRGGHLRTAAFDDLIGGKWSEQPQHVGYALQVLGSPLVNEPLKLSLGALDDLRIEQIP
jgi:hypothetical protein